MTPIRVHVITVGEGARLELELCNDERLEYSILLEAFFQREMGRSDGNGFQMRALQRLCGDDDDLGLESDEDEQNGRPKPPVTPGARAFCRLRSMFTM